MRRIRKLHDGEDVGKTLSGSADCEHRIAALIDRCDLGGLPAPVLPVSAGSEDTCGFFQGDVERRSGDRLRMITKQLRGS
jgi:hypothetical protein